MDSLTITIIFILLSGLIGVFVKGRMRDRCLMDFSGSPVTIEFKDGKYARGVMRLEPTGLELTYDKPEIDETDKHAETTFMLYKTEYPDISRVSRFIDEIDEKSMKTRAKQLRGVRNQRGLRRLGRKMRNFFATIRDSVMEVLNLFIGKVRQATPARGIVAGQDKYVSQMQTGVLSTVQTAFEPLLERHIGKKVVLQHSGGEKLVEYTGILKGYTAEFVELMDLSYKPAGREEAKPADLIIPRSAGLVRHLGE